MKCIKFTDGPHKDQYGYFQNSTADAKVKEGVAHFYDPAKAEQVQPEPEPGDDLPGDLPGRDRFLEAGTSFKEVQKLAEKGKLQKVSGIGQSTENKIMEWLDGYDK